MSSPKFMQAADVRVRQVDDQVFLVDVRRDTVYHLNELGSGLWRLLARATDMETAQAVVGQAFPDEDADDVEKDVRTLSGDLVKKGLVTEIPSPPKTGNN